jgi:amidase
MKRKDFFKLTAAGGALAVIAPISACNSTSSDNKALSRPAFSNDAFTVEPSIFEGQTIADIHAKMQAGELSATEITQHYIDRINKYDMAGPKVNAVIALNGKALNEAKKLDTKLKNGEEIGLLHGIPILLKDNINTQKSDGMRTTAGSLALMELWPESDAPIVKKLKKAGAIILGKTNLSEWANFRSTSSSSGWSAVGGLTKNPHILDRSACGSSSGSAAAVAASFCQVAIGTETDGSIVCPSAVNGIVGFKPSVGLVSRTGIIPISESQDTAGPMTRNIFDAIAVLTAIHGEEEEDIKSKEIPSDLATDATSRKLKGAKLGICTNFLGRNTLMDAGFEKVKKELTDAGAELIEVELDTIGYGGAEWEILQYEFKNGLNSYLAKYGNSKTPSSLEDLIAYNIEFADKEMPFFKQETFESSQQKGDLTDKDYLDALKTAKEEAADQIDTIMDKHGLDALIAPTNGPSWVVDMINGDRFTGGSSSAAAVAGYPNITVPAGSHQNLPLGISFFGKKWSDFSLLSLAADYEAQFPNRISPAYLPTLSPLESKISS